MVFSPLSKEKMLVHSQPLSKFKGLKNSTFGILLSFFYSRQPERQSKMCDMYTKLLVYGRMVDRTFLRAIFIYIETKPNQTVNHNLNVERNQ